MRIHNVSAAWGAAVALVLSVGWFAYAWPARGIFWAVVSVGLLVFSTRRPWLETATVKRAVVDGVAATLLGEIPIFLLGIGFMKWFLPLVMVVAITHSISQIRRRDAAQQPGQPEVGAPR